MQEPEIKVEKEKSRMTFIFLLNIYITLKPSCPFSFFPFLSQPTFIEHHHVQGNKLAGDSSNLYP